MLLKDHTISDILINGPKNIYVERRGKMERTKVEFRDNGHLLQIIDRIVSNVGRRVDEVCPMVDARLTDGSRFNAIIPPLALDGAAVSIRRFGANPLKLEDLLNYPPPGVYRMNQIAQYNELHWEEKKYNWDTGQHDDSSFPCRVRFRQKLLDPELSPLLGIMKIENSWLQDNVVPASVGGGNPPGFQYSIDAILNDTAGEIPLVHTPEAEVHI